MKRNGEFAVPPHDGNVKGATGSFGDAGNSTGVTETYGADLGGDACNCQGSIRGTSKSDAPFSKTSKVSLKD